MKAFALISPDKPARLVDLPDPGVPAGAVRVRVRAASVNGFDVFQANGYLFAAMEHQFPTIIGRDFAGIVDAVVDRGDVLSKMAALVREGGRIATTLSAADVEVLAARGIRATNVMGSPTPAMLAALAKAVIAGTLRVEIQQTFPLADASPAFAAFMAGTRGKLVLTLESLERGPGQI